MINFVDGVRHRVFIVPRLSIPDLRGILLSADAISVDLAKVEMQTKKHLDIDTPIESSDDLPISNRMFFITDELQASRADFRVALASVKDVVAIVDDEELKRRLFVRKPDAFISYDSRDRIDLARPLDMRLGALG